MTNKPWWSLPPGPLRSRLKRESSSPPDFLEIPRRFPSCGSPKQHADHWRSAIGIDYPFTTEAESRVAEALAKSGWPPLPAIFRAEQQGSLTFVIGPHSRTIIDPTDSAAATRLFLTKLYERHNAALNDSPANPV
jgi:hypothetical protein